MRLWRRSKSYDFGLIPSEDADKLIANSQPFISALEKNIGMKVKPFVAIDYSAVIEALKSDKLEIAFLGPNAYVLAKDKVKAQVEPVARGVMELTGTSAYKALIITHPSKPISNIADLKGKTFALVDPASTSGNLVPRYVFANHGITPEKDFKSVYYSGTHQASLIAVKEGKVDAAAIADEVYNLAISKGQIKPTDLKVIRVRAHSRFAFRRADQSAERSAGKIAGRIHGAQGRQLRQARRCQIHGCCDRQ